MTDPTTPSFLAAAYAFEQAGNAQDKKAAVLAMLQSGEALYAHHELGDRVAHGLAEEEKRDIYEASKTMTPQTQNVIAIVRKSLVTGTLAGEESNAYSDGIDYLIATHLNDDVSVDEFAAAQLSLEAVTLGLADRHINAVYKAADVASALSAVQNRSHFAQNRNASNQEHALDLIGETLAVVYGHYNVQDIDADKLWAMNIKKSALLMQQNGQDAAASNTSGNNAALDHVDNAAQSGNMMRPGKPAAFKKEPKL